ncbi:MAG: alpha/beta hydrolase fold domain-containing protein [Pseudomonadota bacterium]
MDVGDWATGDPVELRAAYDAERLPLAAFVPEDVRVEEETRPGLHGCLSFLPSDSLPEPVLYFHGGGWMVGSPETHRGLCAWLAKLTRRRVISAPYPLAPENPWPAQPDSALARFEALATLEGRAFTAGDSAGAATALWAAADDKRAAGVLAFYPAFGVTDSPSIDRYGPASPSLNAAAIRKMYDHLVATGDDIQSRVPSTGAPVLILAASLDPLHDDAAALFDHLAERDVTFHEVDGEDHAFLHDACHADGPARDWLTRAGAWMTERG